MKIEDYRLSICILILFINLTCCSKENEETNPVDGTPYLEVEMSKKSFKLNETGECIIKSETDFYVSLCMLETEENSRRIDIPEYYATFQTDGSDNKALKLEENEVFTITQTDRRTVRVEIHPTPEKSRIILSLFPMKGSGLHPTPAEIMIRE